MSSDLVRFPPNASESTENIVKPEIPYVNQLKTARQLLSLYIRNEIFPGCQISLKFSSVIYRKTALKLTSETLREDETLREPMMQTVVWSRGEEWGVVFYDLEYSQVHMIQQGAESQKVSKIDVLIRCIHTSKHFSTFIDLQGMVEMFQSVSAFEVANTLTIMLAAEVAYSEIFDEKV